MQYAFAHAQWHIPIRNAQYIICSISFPKILQSSARLTDNKSKQTVLQIHRLTHFLEIQQRVERRSK